MKHIRNILIIVSIILGLGCGMRAASAAVLSAYPDHRTVNVNDTFSVDIRLNSEQQVVNVVSAVITYPKDQLEVTSVSHGGSFLTLWPVEPTIDSSAGTITLTGGIPNGSYVSDGKIVTITFTTKDVGGVEIGFAESSTSVLLNDGLGTPAPLTLLTGIYNVEARPSIAITSPTHPDQDTWYPSRDVTFEWPMTKNAEYSYVLSENPDDVPDDTAERTSGKITYEDVSDGAHTFILKEKQQGKTWELAGRRRVLVDTTAPELLQAAINRDNSVLVGQYYLTFTATDHASGVDHFDVREGSTTYRGISSPFILKQQNPDIWLTVTAYDHAGNATTWTHGTPPPAERSQNTYYLVAITVIVLGILTAVLIKLRLRHIHNMP